MKQPVFAAAVDDKKVRDAMANISEAIDLAVEVALKRHADAVAVRARELSPVKTGLLRSTIRVRKAKRGYIVKTDHGKAPHDFLVHFGTVKAAPRPFLYWAKEQMQSRVRRTVEEEIARAKLGDRRSAE